jgi:prophage DNA circulation protein
MGQTWEDSLLEGSFDGVVFDFVSVKDDHSNDIDEQRFPGRAGSFLSPRARNARRWDIMAVFIEDDYPDNTATDRGMSKLEAALDNGGAPKKFVHPVEGSFMAAPGHFTVMHDAEDRDSGTIQIQLIEHTDGAAGPTKTAKTTPAQANRVASLGFKVLEALSAFQEAVDFVTTNDYVVQVQGAVAAATSVASSLEASFDELSTQAIAAMTSGAISAVDEALETLADFETTEQYDLSATLSAMAGALTELANDLIEQRPTLQEFPVTADTSLLSWAHDFGYDPNEILSLNSFPDPLLIPAGFKVVAYAQ